MGIFKWAAAPDIHAGLEQFRNTPGAVLLDVRTPQEYRMGHIPASRSVPLQRLSQIDGQVDDHSTPLFVYCLAGARSRQAVMMLRSMGYRQVTDLGGIDRYSGPVEQGGGAG